MELSERCTTPRSSLSKIKSILRLARPEKIKNGGSMRKQTTNSSSEAISGSGDVWLDLERLAQVEITSENAEHPIESALISDGVRGWRAAQPGKQKIRRIFAKLVA